ncbi:hypothetical protein K493DRAFT_335576 [Basidiobolus meristosporus CBS 931.73]|uniref:Uncharacterized protein n=1 Tax=Basidiobolus meristosporus CBS 931.73 TaxID=1314790 RepID=A0A1Y1YP86_9FUNG|nr:hypothetical protein K493DRAFT_335576 [Basidiobolus meristosporus CBS 931.73]|eukprot:ORX99850.1 hypothetical protein K493DRAFT_335576 [Basidiobolus meristosporus CBS 931.73]
MSTTGRSWETAETKLLINLRQNMDHEFTTKKRNAPLWKKISEYVNNAGYQRTDKQCKEKWKNLLSEYKRADMQETDQRAFPYYGLLKDFLDKHTSIEKSFTMPYPPSPAHGSRLDHKYGSSTTGYPPPARELPLIKHSSEYSYSHPVSAFSYHMTRPLDAPTTMAIDTPSTQMIGGHDHRSSPEPKRRRRSISNNSWNLLLIDIVDLLRREVGERRKWEEKLEQNQAESERRRERQEKRRKRREKCRLERQKAQTLLLVAIASKIIPNVSDLIRSANFYDISSSDSNNSG